MKIIYRKDNEKLFLQNWQSFLNKEACSFRYLPLFLDYMLLYTQNLVEDKSFVAVKDGQCIAIAFLPIEQPSDGNKTISLANGYTISPLATTEKIEKKIYAHIDELARNLEIKKIKFYLDPLIIEYKNKFNNLTKYNFINTTTADGLLKLDKKEDALWSNVRKGHKSDINKILRNPEYEVISIDHQNHDYQIHEQYRELHHKAAGRITRKKETFDKMFDMMKNDNASLFGLKYKDKFIGFNYFIHHNNTVIYASGCDDPDFAGIAIYHPILWKAILYYKQRNFDFMQFSQPCGHNYISGFDDYLDKKQMNISKFKRGFGITMTPFFRGIKYYDKNLFLEDIENFKQQAIKLYANL
jgi:hypothetical protein